MFTTFDKAIAAFLTALVSILVLSHISLPAFLEDPNTIGAISSFLAGVVTYLVPNKASA